jgi:hypothetical protein
VGMNDMKAVRHRYKQRYDFAASEVVGAFDELKSLDWSLEIASLSDVEMSKRWIGAVDPNGVARLPPNGGWDWVKLYNGYLKNPSAFVCAIKSEGKLCALIGGGVSDSKVVTKLHYLESAPYDTALSGYALDISVTYVVTVANAMGSEYTAIYEPNSKVREIAINDYGFSEDNLFGTSKDFALYLPMSRI